MDITLLNKIIEKHGEWINHQEGGKRADLQGVNLRWTNLHGVNLSGAKLCEANLRGAGLNGAVLHGTDLRGANLREAKFYGANLSGADLRGANLYESKLCGADLRGADLRGANLCRTDFYRANIYMAKNIPYIPMACPENGSFIAWKKAGKYIIKLFIPDDAMRSSATGRQCRTNKAKVLEIQRKTGEKADTSLVASDYDSGFIYMVGQEIEVPNFEENRFIECAPGIHFFVNRQEAVEYMG